MEDLLNGGISELETIKTEVREAAALKDKAEESALALRSKEKDLAAQKKYIADKISDEVKARKNELQKTHDGRIADANKEVREAERKRQSAKQDAVTHRIKEETSEMEAENDSAKKEMTALMKKEKILPFCKYSYYFSMFHASTARDYLYFAATVVVCVGLIPNLACALVHASLAVKIVLYIGIVAFFCGIYAAVFFVTGASQKAKAFSALRKKRDRIAANKKKIRQITKGIREDKDESVYHLEDYDAEIQRCRDIVTSLEQKKTDALEAFEKETVPGIEKGITEENQEATQAMETELEQLREEDRQHQEAAKAKQEAVIDAYGTYLGQKNLTEEKLDVLIGFLKEGKAETVLQALDLLKGEIKS